MPAFVRLLGPAAVRLEGEWLEPPTGKTSALLYYLAYQGGWVSRDELLLLFWPDTVEEKARRNLRRLLSTIRTLPYAQEFETESTRIRWPVGSDAAEFKRALAESNLSTVVQLYRGELLQGFKPHGMPEFDSWLELERQTLHNDWRRTVLSFSDELGAGERHQQASEVLERLYLADPFDEETLRRYLEGLYLSGQRSKALEVFSGFGEALKNELDAEPEDATEQLVTRIRDREPLEALVAPGIKAAVDEEASPQHDLPPQPTPFVGREAELVRLAEMLGDPACRLLTLVGSGGIGKTRLAVELVQGQLGRYRDGVFFVPFAAVTSPELMVSAMATALDFTFFGPTNPKEQLLDYLRDKELLLILDNLEQLLEGMSLLSDILTTAPQVTLLATSRERLNLHAESVYDLAGLSYPRDDERAALSYDAVKLFAQSAERSRSEFLLDEQNERAVIRITQLVDGLPLAIELAASWSRVLIPEDIASQIEDGIGFLQASTRDLPERHRSIRAVFDHSWDLLSSEEQTVLRRLSVFRGGFTQQAAAEVAGASLTVLAGLADKSLVRMSLSGRFDQHPLIQQYALEKLAERPEEELQTFDSHSEYYYRLLEQHGNRIPGTDLKERIELAATEWENIEASWKWMVKQRRAEQLQRATLMLQLFIQNKLWYQKGNELFAQAVWSLSEGDTSHHPALAAVLTGQAWMLTELGRNSEAIRLTERALGLLRPLGESQAHAVLNGLDALAEFQNKAGDYARAEANAVEALMLARSLDLLEMEAFTLIHLGENETSQGNYQQAERHYRESLALLRQEGQDHSESNALWSLGELHLIQGHLQEARRLLQEAAELAERIDYRWPALVSLKLLARVAFEQGSFEEATVLSGEALSMAREMRDLRQEAGALVISASLAEARGDYPEARTRFREALSIAWSAKALPTVLESLVFYAEFLFKHGDHVEVRDYLGLVVHHQATEQWVRERAQQVLEELRGTGARDVSEGSEELGRATSLAAVVGDILGSETLT
jgi:predicted ATPase/DNA-binding SARP family transcriptional activator